MPWHVMATTPHFCHEPSLAFSIGVIRPSSGLRLLPVPTVATNTRPSRDVISCDRDFHRDFAEAGFVVFQRADAGRRLAT